MAGKLPLPIPAPLFSTALGAGRLLGLPRLPPEVVPWLRNGVTLDCTRLTEEVGFRPRSTLETVEEFIAHTGGRRVAPGNHDAAFVAAAPNGGSRRSDARRAEVG